MKDVSKIKVKLITYGATIDRLLSICPLVSRATVPVPNPVPGLELELVDE